MSVTFDPPPQVLLRPELPLLPLSTMPQRLSLIERLGVDVALVFVTTPRFLNMTAEQFLHDLLGRELAVRGLAEGRNFGFGKDRCGDIPMLQHWCARRRIPLELVDDVYRLGLRISSSAIRSLLIAGDVEMARRALGRPYAITGQVVRGDERGRRIGFPTANLAEIRTMLPATGVYAGAIRFAGQGYVAAVNVGPNPTFGISERKVEAHLLDFSGDLYGQTLTLEFLARLRDTRPFPSLPAIQEQLATDVRAAREAAGPYLQRVKREHDTR